MSEKTLRTGRIERQHLLVVAVAVLMALAGCSGLSGGDGTATETPAANGTATAAENGTPTPADDATTPTPDGTAPDETPTDDTDDTSDLDTEINPDSWEFGTTLDSEVTAADGSVTATAVRDSALQHIESTDTYQAEANLSTSVETANGQRASRRQTDLWLNRSAETFQANLTTNTARGQVSQDSYLVGETLYQRSAAFVQRYNTEWIQSNVSGNESEIFRTRDELQVHSNLIENGTASLSGVQNVDGNETYRLRIELNNSEYASAYGLQVTEASEAQMVVVVWVDTESGAVVRSEGQAKIVSTNRGQTGVTRLAFTEHFEYTDVDVTLPEAAVTAVSTDDQQSQT